MPHATHVLLLAALGYTGRQCAAAECQNGQTSREYCCAQYAPLRIAWMSFHLTIPFTSAFDTTDNSRASA
jgi:hypothetical protein